MLDTITFLQGLETPPTVITTSYGDNEENFGQTLATYVSCVVIPFVALTFGRKMCDGYMSVSARGVSNLFASGDVRNLQTN